MFNLRAYANLHICLTCPSTLKPYIFLYKVFFKKKFFLLKFYFFFFQYVLPQFFIRQRLQVLMVSSYIEWPSFILKSFNIFLPQ